jgi:class 3 adenylate cyclase/tetratricopeptide (TPR) repeat protein
VSFLETVEKARAFLERNERVSLRALKREFELDDDALDELIEELVDVQQVAARDGRVLAWAGPARSEPEAPSEPPDVERAPRDYTPKHLADKILQSKSALEGERKQVTVLFADVRSSMDLQQGVDPEEWHGIMDRFFQILADGVHRFEGTVNQYTGDGIMALFGAPIAHEDHAQRACYTALHLAEELRGYANELRLGKGLNFSVRMGLNSGEVVVGKIGDDLRMDYTAQGQTVGLAARMEQLAEAGKTYLTEHTAKLTKGYFQLADLGPLEVKGVSEPVGVYELEGAGALRTRLEVSKSRGFSRFVGRAEEMQILETALARAEAGNPQIVGIVADAGVGKSRLCAEFLERCRARRIMTYDTTGVSHGKSVPLLPILSLFRAFFGIGEQDSDATARERIAGRLVLLDESFRELLPVLFDFLGVADPANPPPRLDPAVRQRQLFAVVRGVSRARAERETSVMLLEDLHWFDGGSQAFLEPLLDRPPGDRTLVVLNFRPEYQSQWLQKSSYQQIPLLPLGPEAISELLGDLLGNDPSLARLPELIRERTSGNPFFIEEVVLSLAEAGILKGEKGAFHLEGTVDKLRIPPTVQGILGARIDRLEEKEKLLLQTASVIGKKFPETVLRRIAELPDKELSTALRSLQSAEFVYEEALYPETEYAFKHPLTQQVAYETQLRERRSRVHAAVARVIEELYAEKLDEQAALLAYHWELAGEPATAVAWHRRAAEWAGVNEPSEALRHWDRVRTLVADLPPEKEMLANGAKACSQIVNLGWRLGGSEEDAARTFEEGCRLATRSGDRTSLSVLNGSYAALRGLNVGDVNDYVQYGQEAVKIADQTRDEALQYAMRTYLGFANDFAGNLETGLAIADEAFALGPREHAFGAQYTGYSPSIAWLGVKGMALSAMGRTNEARPLLEELVELARTHGYPEMITWGYSELGGMDRFLGDGDRLRGHARALVEIKEKVGAATYHAMAYLAVGQAHLVNEEWSEAISALEETVRFMEETRSAGYQKGNALSCLADALLAAGRVDEARARAEEGLGWSRSRGLHRDINPWIACARVLMHIGDPESTEQAGVLLDEVQAIIEERGTRLYQAHVDACRAALAAGERAN